VEQSKEKRKVLYVTLLEGIHRIKQLFFSSISAVPHEALNKKQWMTAEQRKRVTDALHQMKTCEGCFFIVDDSVVDRNLDLLVANHDLVIVDALNLLSKNESYFSHCQDLKILARRYGCTVVLLDQFDDKVYREFNVKDVADYWIRWRYNEQERETGLVELSLTAAPYHNNVRTTKAKLMLDTTQVEVEPWL